MAARFSLTLPRHQARLLYLAIVYHLARPGSEVDPTTLQEYEHGLTEVRVALEPQLAGESVSLSLTPFQMARLDSALLGIINELHMYSVFDRMAGESGRPRSLAAGFDETLKELFPEMRDDPSYASQLAEDVMMLRRELAESIKRAKEALAEEEQAAQAARKAAKKPWQLWKR